MAIGILNSAGLFGSKGSRSGSITNSLGTGNPANLSAINMATKSLASGIPQIDTGEVAGGLASRGTSIGTTEAANLGRTFGGNTADPQYLRGASRARVHAASDASSAIANLDLNQKNKNAELETQRRSQLLQLAGLQNQIEQFRSQQDMESSQWNKLHPLYKQEPGFEVGSGLPINRTVLANPSEPFALSGSGGGFSREGDKNYMGVNWEPDSANLSLETPPTPLSLPPWT